MPRDYLPSREAELVTWGANFKALTTATPLDFGLTVEQAASFSAKQDVFATSYQIAKDPSTRSPMAIEAKNDAKRELIAEARMLAGIVQKCPTVTNPQRVQLGLTVRDADPTPIPAPSEMPQLDITSVVGWTLSIQLHDGTSSRRAKPSFVQGAYVFTYVGDEPPADINAWKFEGSSSKTDTKVVFPSTLTPGTKVWLTAAWVNAKLQTGPACSPVSTRINYGGMAQAA